MRQNIYFYWPYALFVSIPHAIAYGIYYHMTTSHNHLVCLFDQLLAIPGVGICTQYSSHMNINFQLFKHQFISLEVNSVIK